MTDQAVTWDDQVKWDQPPATPPVKWDSELPGFNADAAKNAGLDVGAVRNVLAGPQPATPPIQWDDQGTAASAVATRQAAQMREAQLPKLPSQQQIQGQIPTSLKTAVMTPVTSMGGPQSERALTSAYGEVPGKALAGAGGALDAFTSPAGVGTAAALAGAPAAVARGAGYAFGSQMLDSIARQSPELYAAAKEGRWGDAAKLAANMGVSGLLTAAIGRHLAGAGGKTGLLASQEKAPELPGAAEPPQAAEPLPIKWDEKAPAAPVSENVAKETATKAPLSEAVPSYPQKVAAPLESPTGLRPALKSKDGQVFAGRPGATHFEISDMDHPEIKGRVGEVGFVDDGGNFLTREQAEDFAKARGIKIKPWEVGHGLDAMALRDHMARLAAEQGQRGPAESYPQKVAALQAEVNKAPKIGLGIEHLTGEPVLPEYSEPGLALRNVAGRHGVHNLEANWPESADALTRAVKSPEYARFAGKAEVKRISQAMGDKKGGEEGWQQFSRPMIDSQLKGMQDYYTKQGSPEEAAKVERLMSDDELAAYVADPQFQAARKLWDEGIGHDMREAHVANGGQRIAHVGPAASYYPLVSEEVGGGPSGSKIPMQKPKAPGSQHRTGQSEAYDGSSAAIIGEEKPGGQYGRFPAALRANNIGRALDQFRKDGILVDLAPGQRAPRFMEVNGKQMATHVEPTRRGNVMIPKALEPEIVPALQNTAAPEMTKIGAVLSAPTRAAVMGIAEPLGHGTNIAGTLASKGRMLDFGAGKTGNAILNLPGLKEPASFIASIAKDPRNPENVALLREGYEDGVFGPRGVFHNSPGGKLISRMDTNARLMLYKSAKEFEPNATPSRYREIVRLLGEYSAQLASEDVRTLKTGRLSRATGNLAPFVTAGKTMGLNAAEDYGNLVGKGTAPIGGGGLANRLAAAATRGPVAATVAWAALTKAITGELPWEGDNKQKMKLFQVPVPASWRQTAIGKNLWGDKPGTAYISLRNSFPMAVRGAKYLGIRGLFETLARGGTSGQAGESAALDVLNSQAQPYEGPPVQAISRAFNVEPQLKSLRDDKGNFGPQFWNVDKQRAVPGADTVTAAAKRVARGLNTTAREASEGPFGGATGTGPLRFISDTLPLPATATGPSRPEMQGRMLKRQLQGSRRPSRQ